LAASPVVALTGNQLKEFADQGEENSDFYSEAYFDGYVTGVREETFTMLCFRNGVTNVLLLAVVKKYLKDHPERLHIRAAVLVIDGIKLAWPCK
jgi:hypothetical protein